jgi:hypothetical protein
MSEIVGIACVYGITVSLIELQSILDIDEEINFQDLQQVDDPNIKRYLPSGISVYTHPDWDEMVILGSVIVTLETDPSLTGSTMAPVITIPDVFDYTLYTDERPMYYQVPILNTIR